MKAKRSDVDEKATALVESMCGGCRWHRCGCLRLEDGTPFCGHITTSLREQMMMPALRRAVLAARKSRKVKP